MKNGGILGHDYKLAAIITVTTFVLVLEHYHHIGPKFPEIIPQVSYVIIPLSISYLLFREKPSDFGIRTGNWRVVVISVVLCFSVMVVVIYAVANLHDFKDYYRLQKDPNWGKLCVDTTFYMFSWEFIFRGYLLFGLEKSIGRIAIFIQAFPFALLYIGKPELEAFNTLFGEFNWRRGNWIQCNIKYNKTMEVLSREPARQ